MQFEEFLNQAGTPMQLERGQHVFRSGESDVSIYLLRKGLLKAYYLSEEGKESIKSFVFPGELIGSLASAHRKEACSFSLVCLQPSALVRLSFNDIYNASRNDLGIASAMVDHLLGFAMRKERREREFLTESAEERYRLVLESFPLLHEAVTQKDIARYLGITPVALSRIKKRMESGAREE